jgi:hypothetical protein
MERQRETIIQNVHCFINTIERGREREREREREMKREREERVLYTRKKFFNRKEKEKNLEMKKKIRASTL